MYLLYLNFASYVILLLIMVEISEDDGLDLVQFIQLKMDSVSLIVDRI